MPNTNRPDDTRCPADAHVIECSFTGSAIPGVCKFCDLGSCALCGGPMTPGQCIVSKRQTTGTIGDEVYCPACLPGVVADAADGVPEVVEEEETVRAAYEPIGVEGLGDVRAERKAASL